MLELIAIFVLGFNIYSKQNDVAIVINPIKEDGRLITPRDGHLKHFMEPAPNATFKKPIVSILPETVVTYTHNSDSLNERFEYTIIKPKNTFRIVNLGDSWSYGWGVNTKDNYSEVLEDLLNNKFQCKNFKKFEVLNLAVDGYDIEFSAERFRRRGQKYNPDLVIWLIKHDDFFPQELIHPLVNAKPIDKSYFENGKVVNPTHSVVEKAFEEMLNRLGKEKMIQYEISALNRFNDYYKDKLLLFLYNILPDERRALEEFIESREHTYIYMKTRNLQSNEIIQGDGHPNKMGHQIFANDLFNYITKHTIIPCN